MRLFYASMYVNQIDNSAILILWREQTAIGAHLVNAIAIAVQRCTGLALRVSLEKERRVALGVAAA